MVPDWQYFVEEKNVKSICIHDDQRFLFPLDDWWSGRELKEWKEVRARQCFVSAWRIASGEIRLPVAPCNNFWENAVLATQLLIEIVRKFNSASSGYFGRILKDSLRFGYWLVEKIIVQHLGFWCSRVPLEKINNLSYFPDWDLGQGSWGKGKGKGNLSKVGMARQGEVRWLMENRAIYCLSSRPRGLANVGNVQVGATQRSRNQKQRSIFLALNAIPIPLLCTIPCKTKPFPRLHRYELTEHKPLAAMSGWGE